MGCITGRFDEERESHTRHEECAYEPVYERWRGVP